MPRVANQVETVFVRVSTTPKIRAYLETLAKMELYGKTAPEVAERFISERIRELISDKTLERK